MSENHPEEFNAVGQSGSFPQLLVIVPARNEIETIRSVLTGIRSVVPEADILVVDDGSTDRTGERAMLSGVKVLSHPFNLGYGAALESGYQYALMKDYRYVVQLDADGQHDPRDIPTILAPLYGAEADLVIGSRFLSSGPSHSGWLRVRACRILSRLTSGILGWRITDATSGFQGCNREAVDFLARGVLPRDFPDADVLIMLSRARFRLMEVAVQELPRLQGHSMHQGLRSVYYCYKMGLAMLLTLMRNPGRPESKTELTCLRDRP